MGFMKLNRFGASPPCEFEPEKVLQKLRDTFSDVTVLPGDQLALSTERAGSAGAADHVVQTLRRNQQEYGPALAFEIRTDGKRVIEGRTRRYDVTFLFPDSLPEAWRQQLLRFLQSLGAGRLEQAPEMSQADICPRA